MVETVTTMVSLLLSAGAAGVIGVSIWDDRQALRRALTCSGSAMRALPPHTRRVAGPRPARFIRLQGSAALLRAAA